MIRKLAVKVHKRIAQILEVDELFLAEEQELYIPNALVEVFEANVFINHKEVKLPLHNTILMKA